MSTLLGDILMKRGTAAQWTAANDVLRASEHGYETDTHKQKIGDGTTAWNSLAYTSGPGLWSLLIENVNAVATSGAAVTIPDVTVATLNRVVLTANCTLTFPTAAAGKTFLIALVQDGTGSRTATWPSTVKWPSGTTPTLTATANKTDLFSFSCLDGTNWLSLVVGQAF
jgi:hypothetical protein